MKKLVILGGGYGGMRVLQRLLPNQLPEDVSITLVDKVPYHSLKTEFFALAAGTVSDKNVRVQFPTHPRLETIFGEVKSISLEERLVYFVDRKPLSYDDLIIGLGSEDKYHHVHGAGQFTYSLQNIEKARKTYQALENLSPGSEVAIIGAGLTGVELASELNESRKDLNIKLFDRKSFILSSFPERLSTYVENWFDTNGVEIINNANITEVEENILYNHDEPIKFDVIIWTAGIQPSKMVRDLNVEKDNTGRIVLTPQHNIPNYDHVYVLGDCASLPYSPSAQLAETQAEQIVQVLIKRWKGEAPPESFPPLKLKGVLGTLGKKQGFGLLADRTITGRVARMLKSGILWVNKYHNG